MNKKKVKKAAETRVDEAVLDALQRGFAAGVKSAKELQDEFDDSEESDDGDDDSEDE